MNKNDFLKQIAEKAYDVGFGAKKHFATLDIVDKVPGLIGFISLVIGVLALYIDSLSNKDISAILIVSSIIAMYISFYNSDKNTYEEKGIVLTKILNELKSFYYQVKADGYEVLETDIAKLEEIESRYYDNAISKQILFSGWYAHYKFFWEMQIDWIDEQKQFKFWRDKLPLSLIVSFSFSLIVLLGYLFGECIAKTNIIKGLIQWMTC